MATAAQTASTGARKVAQTGFPAGGLRFDWAYIGLSALFVAGLWVDGWAHFHGQVDDSFFTPWHFLFYSAFGFVALFTGFHHWRNTNRGYAFQQALPRGYWLSLIGVVTFGIGGVGDMIWHTLFGIEAGSEALTSPTHILLAVGMTLIISGPLRAAWLRPKVQGWRQLGPSIISATLLLSLFAFFTSYAHPLVNPLAASFNSRGTDVQQFNQLYVMNADGSAQTRLIATPHQDITGFSWSPDGTQIVYGAGEPDGGAGQVDLYLMNADGTNPVQFTSADGEESSPAWSPDGGRIAYVSETGNGQSNLYTLPASGGEPTLLLNVQADELWGLSWSPDGAYIAYTLTQGGAGTLYAIQAEGGSPVQLVTDGPAYDPVWSPDGGEIVYIGRSGSSYDLLAIEACTDSTATCNPQARQLTVSDAFDAFASFSPDGTQIVFMSSRDGVDGLYQIPASGETAENPAVNISNNPALQFNDAAFSPDGNRILYTARGISSGGGLSSQDFGVGSVLLQAGLLASVVLALMWRWSLPFGTFTLMFGLNGLMMILLNDLFFFVPGAILAGLLADVLVARMKPSAENAIAFHRLGFIIPVLYFSLYFLGLQLIIGMGWNIHVWAGAIVVSGVIGLLLSYLITSGTDVSNLLESA